MRKALVKANRSLKKVPFPKKTLMNWSKLLFKKFSKFDSKLIEKRKEGLEAFLNVVLEDKGNLQNDRLCSLLKIPKF